MAAVVVAVVVVSEGLTPGLIPVATGLGDLLQVWYWIYLLMQDLVFAAVVLGDGSWLQGLVTG